MTLPNQFFTVESLGTLTGASGLTFVITNGIQKAFNYKPAWIGLFVAVTISLVGVYFVDEKNFKDYVVGFFNGFLIFATAAGATEATSAKSQSPNGSDEDTFGESDHGIRNKSRRSFTSSWFR